MKHIKQEFNDIFSKQLKNIIKTLLKKLKSGIVENKLKTSFLGADIKGSIEFQTYCSSDTYDIDRFKKILHDKIDNLTNQISLGIDKGIEYGVIKNRVSEGNLICYIKIETTRMAMSSM